MTLDKNHEERIQKKLLQRAIEKKQIFRLIAYIASLFVLAVALLLTLGPIYVVWSQRLFGEAELARAESNRQIRILEAKAEQKAAKILAEADAIRAEDVTRALKR